MMYLFRASALWLLAALSIGLLPSHAQVTSKVEIQFLGFPMQLRPEPVELVVGEEKTIEVQTPGNELSPIYEVPRLDRIVVGKTIENEEGESVFQVYGSADAINASKQIVLLFRKGKENSDGFVVLPINGELANFRGGGYFFFNASKTDVAVLIGDKKFTLSTGNRNYVEPNATHPGGGCQVTFAYKKGEEWKPFKDTRWTTSDGFRTMVFFHQHPDTGRLMVSPVIDMLPYNPEVDG